MGPSRQRAAKRCRTSPAFASMWSRGTPLRPASSCSRAAGWWGAASAGSCTGVGFCATALAVRTSPLLASRSPPSCPASRSCSILYQPKPPQGNPTQTGSGEARVSALVFKNASILDGQQNEALTDHNVLVENGEIREVSDGPITTSSARVIDLAGKTLMPGLIDCHVH